MSDIKPILDNLRQWLRVARGFSRPSPSPFEAGMADYIADYTNEAVADQPAHAPSIGELAAILAYIDGKSIDKDKYEIAFERIKFGEQRVIDAAMWYIPCAYDIDMQEAEAFKKLLSAIAKAAIYGQDNKMRRLSDPRRQREWYRWVRRFRRWVKMKVK